MSIQPIFTSVFSSIPSVRGMSPERTFGSSKEETKDPLNPVVAASAAAQNGQAAGSVAATSGSSKASDRSPYPEKSTDSEKTRSASGDILDLSTKSEKETANKETKESREKENSEKARSAKEQSSNLATKELTEAEKQQVAKLKARDAEVRTHEAAHLAAAGQYAQGGAQFEYQTGPDGKKYAIGGHVSISSGPVSGDPEATLQKARQIRAAALAPASPSSQDQKVAAAASQMEADARIQLNREKTEERKAAFGSDSFASSAETSKNEESKEKQNVGGMHTLASESSEKTSQSSEPKLAEQTGRFGVDDALKKAEEKSLIDSLLESASKKNDDADKAQSLQSQSKLSSGTAASEYQRQQFSSPRRVDFVAYA